MKYDFHTYRNNVAWRGSLEKKSEIAGVVLFYSQTMQCIKMTIQKRNNAASCKYLHETKNPAVYLSKL